MNSSIEPYARRSRSSAPTRGSRRFSSGIPVFIVPSGAGGRQSPDRRPRALFRGLAGPTLWFSIGGSPVRKPRSIAPAEGRLAVLLPGLGAVATTLIAGVEAVKRGMAKPIGSLTQLASVRLGKRTEKRSPPIKDLVPIAELDDLRFGAWDVFPDDAYASACHAKVLEQDLVDKLREPLQAVKPMTAVFSPEYVRRLDGPNVKKAPTKRDLGELLREDIRRFMRENDCGRGVMVWCASTEVYLQPSAVHAELGEFERAMAANDPAIAPSMIYAWAALKEGIPFANGAPNLTVDVPALQELARAKGVAIA